jgi:hypothetical protein
MLLDKKIWVKSLKSEKLSKAILSNFSQQSTVKFLLETLLSMTNTEKHLNFRTKDLLKLDPCSWDLQLEKQIQIF